jgi:hypothetical protein
MPRCPDLAIFFADGQTEPIALSSAHAHRVNILHGNIQTALYPSPTLPLFTKVKEA